MISEPVFDSPQNLMENINTLAKGKGQHVNGIFHRIESYGLKEQYPSGTRTRHDMMSKDGSTRGSGRANTAAIG